MTGSATVVILRENRGATDRHDALATERFHDPFARNLLDDSHLHRRKKFAIGKLRQTFLQRNPTA